MEENLKEQTRMVAEFMGWIQSSTNLHLMKGAFNINDDTYYKQPLPFSHEGSRFYIPTPKFGCRVESMHYHESWDWLMPVIVKVNEQFEEYNLYPTEFHRDLKRNFMIGNIKEMFEVVIDMIDRINKEIDFITPPPTKE